MDTGGARSTHRDPVRSAAPYPLAADLYCDIMPSAKPRMIDYWPGLLVTMLALIATQFVSEHYGAPPTVIGLLIGLSLNFLGSDARLHPGLGFASTTMLRVGIVLIGARVTLGDIGDLGITTLACLVMVVAVTILSGWIFARILGHGSAFGVLVGGAVAICGASAAMAFATLLGDRRIAKGQLALVLIGISAMSAMAMFAYPMLAHAIGLNDRQAGFFLGASIHDIAQALGAGYAFSVQAGETATIVKLTRVACLGPVLMIIGLLMSGRGGPRGSAFLPWFVIGFVLLAAINSTGIVAPAIAQALGGLGGVLITASVIAAAIRSPVAGIVDQGARPLLAIFGATVIAGLVSLLFASLML